MPVSPASIQDCVFHHSSRFPLWVDGIGKVMLAASRPVWIHLNPSTSLCVSLAIKADAAGLFLVAVVAAWVKYSAPKH